MALITVVFPKEIAGSDVSEVNIETEGSETVLEILLRAGVDMDLAGIILGPEGLMKFNDIVLPPGRIVVLPSLSAG